MKTGKRPKCWLSTTSDVIVAEAGFERATSRLWAWRATNCSTPRCFLSCSLIRLQRYNSFFCWPNISVVFSVVGNVNRFYLMYIKGAAGGLWSRERISGEWEWVDMKYLTGISCTPGAQSSQLADMTTVLGIKTKLTTKLGIMALYWQPV